MGLLKETMQAVIRISENLDIIRMVMSRDDEKLYRANYQQKSIEQVRADLCKDIDGKLSLFDRLPQLDEFPYPDHLTFGGRLKAVRMFVGLTQAGLAGDLGVTPPHISNLEADKSEPSAMLIRSVSMRYGINEQWLATGHLPQTTEEPAKPIAMSKVTPLSGYGERKPLQTLEQMKEQMENLMGFYPQTPQSKDTLTSDRPS